MAAGLSKIWDIRTYGLAAAILDLRLPVTSAITTICFHHHHHPPSHKIEASTWMGDHRGRPPAPPIRQTVDWLWSVNKCRPIQNTFSTCFSTFVSNWLLINYNYLLNASTDKWPELEERSDRHWSLQSAARKLAPFWGEEEGYRTWLKNCRVGNHTVYFVS